MVKVTGVAIRLNIMKAKRMLLMPVLRSKVPLIKTRANLVETFVKSVFLYGLPNIVYN